MINHKYDLLFRRVKATALQKGERYLFQIKRSSPLHSTMRVPFYATFHTSTTVCTIDDHSRPDVSLSLLKRIPVGSCTPISHLTIPGMWIRAYSIDIPCLPEELVRMILDY